MLGFGITWTLPEHPGMCSPQYGMQEVSGSIPLGSTNNQTLSGSFQNKIEQVTVGNVGRPTLDCRCARTELALKPFAGPDRCAGLSLRQAANHHRARCVRRVAPAIPHRLQL